jgi:hypothetical protein
MFEMPEEFVSIEKLGQLGFGNEPTVGETGQRDECVRCAEPLVVPAVRELQRLGYELDLAYPAAAQL